LAAPAREVDLFRGLADVFSRGMDTLTHRPAAMRSSTPPMTSIRETSRSNCWFRSVRQIPARCRRTFSMW
jgi:hypothetical protein